MIITLSLLMLLGDFEKRKILKTITQPTVAHPTQSCGQWRREKVNLYLSFFVVTKCYNQ